MTKKRLVIWISVVGGCILFCSASLVVFLAVEQTHAAGRIVLGVRVQGLDLSGQTADQARNTLERLLAARIPRDIPLIINTQLTQLAPDDEQHPFFSNDLSETLAQALGIGHQGSFWHRSLVLTRLRLHAMTLPVHVTVNDENVLPAFQHQIVARLPQPHNAELRLSVNGNTGQPNVIITPEQAGWQLSSDSLLNALHQQARDWQFLPINVAAQTFQPAMTAQDIQTALRALPNIMRHAPFQLTGQHQTWSITPNILAGWLNVTSTDRGPALVLDPERVAPSLQTVMAAVLRKPKPGALEVIEQTVTSTRLLSHRTHAASSLDSLSNVVTSTQLHAVKFEPPVEGVVLDTTSTIAAIEAGWNAASSTIPASLRFETPAISGSDSERLGIHEVLGIGYSQYSGSPVNRQKNIALGAKKMQGVLVAPDEEFSLLKIIGPVNGSTGWFKELVIKEDKTTPEYGGGLCQIGTTTFRSVLAAGLPITVRQNHSYRVGYYEPAGTDATIYEPAPDFRFKNDTGHWTLFTTENDPRHSRLAFSIWGTRDGRTVKQGTPHVYNIVHAPPKKEIETLDLPPGKTKCTEHAHAGADASFDYSVTYATGETKSRVFKSHYKPWGAVCLIGVKQLSQNAKTQPKVDTSGINNPN